MKRKYAALALALSASSYPLRLLFPLLQLRLEHLQYYQAARMQTPLRQWHNFP